MGGLYGHSVAQGQQHPYFPWVIKYEGVGQTGYSFPSGGWGPAPWPPEPSFDSGFSAGIMGGGDAEVLQTFRVENAGIVTVTLAWMDPHEDPPDYVSLLVESSAEVRLSGGLVGHDVSNGCGDPVVMGYNPTSPLAAGRHVVRKRVENGGVTLQFAVSATANGTGGQPGPATYSVDARVFVRVVPFQRHIMVFRTGYPSPTERVDDEPKVFTYTYPDDVTRSHGYSGAKLQNVVPYAADGLTNKVVLHMGLELYPHVHCQDDSWPIPRAIEHVELAGFAMRLDMGTESYVWSGPVDMIPGPQLAGDLPDSSYPIPSVELHEGRPTWVQEKDWTGVRIVADPWLKEHSVGTERSVRFSFRWPDDVQATCLARLVYHAATDNWQNIAVVTTRDFTEPWKVLPASNAQAGWMSPGNSVADYTEPDINAHYKVWAYVINTIFAAFRVTYKPISFMATAAGLNPQLFMAPDPSVKHLGRDEGWAEAKAAPASEGRIVPSDWRGQMAARSISEEVMLRDVTTWQIQFRLLKSFRHEVGDGWGPGGYTGQVLQTATWPSEIGGSEKKWYYIINFNALPE